MSEPGFTKRCPCSYKLLLGAAQAHRIPVAWQGMKYSGGGDILYSYSMGVLKKILMDYIVLIHKVYVSYSKVRHKPVVASSVPGDLKPRKEFDWRFLFNLIYTVTTLSISEGCRATSTLFVSWL